MSRIDVPSPGAARSFWLQEALAFDPGQPAPPLDTYVATDVCIIGGGFAGLWTAVHLTEREPGLRIVLVEQDIVGGGASGRNGGFFSSSWWDVRSAVGLFGETEGVRYLTALSDSIVETDAFCRANGIDAWFHREGIVGVRAAWQVGSWNDDAPALVERLGLEGRLRSLSAEEVRAFADSSRLVGGTFVGDNAICQPARLARGLRKVLLDRGVRIHERTKVTGVDRSRPAVVRTEHGAVRAEHVVLTTGAWAAGWRDFHRSFAVVVDYVVATEPIPDRLAEIGWTSMVGLADGRDLLYYLRPTEDGRIVIGGGGMGVVFGGRADSRAVTHDRRVAEAAARGLSWLFPQLEGTRFTHAWGGPIDQTPSFYPFYRTLAPGNIHAGLGYSGHGLSQTMVGGKILASTVLGLDDGWTSLPVNRPELALAPPEPLRWPVVKAAGIALETGDAREDAGLPRTKLRSWIGSGPNAYRDRLVRRGAGRRHG